MKTVVLLFSLGLSDRASFLLVIGSLPLILGDASSLFSFVIVSMLLVVPSALVSCGLPFGSLSGRMYALTYKCHGGIFFV